MSNESFINTKNKFRRFWNNVEANRVTIQVQKNDQTVIVSELGRSISVNNKVDKIIELNTEWVTPDVAEFVSVGSEIPRTVFKNWEVVVIGLNFRDAVALRHNFNFRFGGGTLDADVRPFDSIIHTNNYVLSDSLEEGAETSLTFYYGMFMDDSAGLEEVQEDGMEVRLQLTLLNPNYHS